MSAAAPRKRPSTRSLVFSFIVHGITFYWFASVWLWHLTPPAQALPGAQGWGWFVRFLTFYSYTLQTLMLGMATVDDWTALYAVLRPASRRRWPAASSNKGRLLSGATDDLACALFALAHVVTIMFYAIQGATGDIVEGGDIQRPPWLNSSVHALNTVVAWVDLLVSPRRTFSRRSERLSSCLVLLYLSYILLCRHMNGRFPYPFLNKMPMPSGFIAMTVCGLALFYAMFKLGRALARRVFEPGMAISVELEWGSSAAGTRRRFGGRWRAQTGELASSDEVVAGGAEPACVAGRHNGAARAALAADEAVAVSNARLL